MVSRDRIWCRSWKECQLLRNPEGTAVNDPPTRHTSPHPLLLGPTLNLPSEQVSSSLYKEKGEFKGATAWHWRSRATHEHVLDAGLWRRRRRRMCRCCTLSSSVQHAFGFRLVAVS